MARSELLPYEEKMKGVVEATRAEFASIRTGRANPAILDKIMVESYGAEYPINQLATISVPEPRLITIQPWDKTLLSKIEKAILKSDLGLVPISDGNMLRISLPRLTEERRKELVKLTRKRAEEMRVAIRNHRRDANEFFKAKEKAGEISEDDLRRLQDEVQKLTDKYIEQIDNLLKAKEEEIMEV